MHLDFSLTYLCFLKVILLKVGVLCMGIFNRDHTSRWTNKKYHSIFGLYVTKNSCSMRGVSCLAFSTFEIFHFSDLPPYFPRNTETLVSLGSFVQSRKNDFRRITGVGMVINRQPYFALDEQKLNIIVPFLAYM
jgi:hypothetical protein